jgi:hypothetical protein
VVLAILVIVVKHPSDAADYVKTVFGWIDQIATFLRELAGSSASMLASAPIRAASALLDGSAAERRRRRISRRAGPCRCSHAVPLQTRRT